MNVNVIIIDDDPITVHLHQLLLKKSELTMNPMGFLNGQKALDHLDAREHWDTPLLLLLDINMPWMSGWELLEQINLRPYAEHVFVIIISSSVDTNDRKKGKTFKQVIGHLEKPIDVIALRNDLKTLDVFR